MKALLVCISLSLGLLTHSGAFAQQADTATIDTSPNSVIEVSVDEQNENVDKQLDQAVEGFREALGQEFSDDLAKELKNLSPEEKKQLISAFEDGFNIDMNNIGLGETAVALVAIMFSLGMPIIILLLVLFFSYRKRRQKMELINAYLSKDRDVPEAIVAEFNSNETSSLGSAIQLIAIGIGVIVALYLTGNEGIAAFGLIPLFVGGARFLVWKYNNKPDA